MLTIAIPTYNRARWIGHLLARLCAEMKGLPAISILVSDNCSTDDTAEVVAPFVERHGVRYVRNRENIGVDGNIAQAFRLADTEYVWVCGDDDAPLPGCLAAVVAVLREARPDLLCIPSIWQPEIRDSLGPAIADPSWTVVDALAFARQVNVWVTFISGIITRKSLFAHAADDSMIERLHGTNFVQLAWVLGNLRAGSRFAIAGQPWLLATAGNSGGYAVLETFVRKLPATVEAVLGRDSTLSTAILSRTAIGYLPQLAYDLRSSGANSSPAAANAAIARAPDMMPGGRLLLRSIVSAPPPLASALLFAARVVAAALRRIDRLQSKPGA
jgi:glycosyltransferase involved in cell wall biosynthesis